MVHTKKRNLVEPAEVLIVKAFFLQNTKKWKKKYLLGLEYKDVAQAREDRQNRFLLIKDYRPMHR